MAYLDSTEYGDVMRGLAARLPPAGPGFTPEQIAQANYMEVWFSSFEEPGEDYTRFILYDETGTLIANKIVRGY